MEEIEETQEDDWQSSPHQMYSSELSRSYAFIAAITLLVAAYANRSLTGDLATLPSSKNMHLK